MEQLNIVGPSMKSLSHSYRHDIFGDGNGDDGGGNGDDGGGLSNWCSARQTMPLLREKQWHLRTHCRPWRDKININFIERKKTINQ